MKEEEIIVPEEETFEYNKLRYILNNDGYVCHASIGGLIVCDLGECTEYNGDIPDGYETIEEWYDEEIERLNSWKIVDGNLVYDVAKDNELQELYKKQEKDNSYVCHKELFEVQQQLEEINDVNDSQYQKATATGKIITINNVKKVYPKIKLTNVRPYLFNKVDLITAGKNILPNEASNQTISGITFTQNEDRSITLNGTSTENIEYNIAGTSNNTSPFLCLKKEINYYLSSNGHQIKMYNFDGIDRAEIYNGTGGVIKFTDSDKPVTHIVLSIEKEETFEDVTIYPQLELGESASPYETYKAKKVSIDYSEYVNRPDRLKHSSLKSGTTKSGISKALNYSEFIDYILIEYGITTALINNEEIILDNENVSLFDGYDTIYTIQDTNIEIDYCINVLNVDNLDFLCGKETTNKQFKILDDASIQVNNIYMYSGAKITGGDGLLTNLVYQGYTRGSLFTGGGDYLPLGHSGGGDTELTQRNAMVFTFKLPKNFTIQSAKVYLTHAPINWEMDGNNIIGYSRNLNLYTISSTELNINPITSNAPYSNSYLLIDGALDFTGSPNEITNAESIDIKDEISLTGINQIAVLTSDENVYNSNNDIFGRTGGVVGYLEIIGYTNYEMEV